MPLGKEVGLGPGHIVLDGDPVGTQPLTAAPPHFRLMSIVANGRPSQQLLSSCLLFCICGAYWRHPVNTTEPSVCGGDAALCQITLTTCYFLWPCSVQWKHAVAYPGFPFAWAYKFKSNLGVSIL